jgi:hypothetical protein
LLPSDLPASYSEAVADAEAALVRRDAATAHAALTRAREVAEAIQIDREFVDKKLLRLNGGLSRLPPERVQELRALFGAVLDSVKAGNHIEANRKLNEIARKLGSS